MKLRSFITRTITALILVAVMLAAILYGPYSFASFFGILLFGILWEFYTLINASAEVNIYRPLHSIGGVIIFICAFCVASHITGNAIFLLYMLYMMALFISRLYTKQKNPLRELAYIIMGQLYIAYPMSMLSALAFHTLAFPMGEMLKDYSPLFVLSLFFFIWINDTGAYLTGEARLTIPRKGPCFILRTTYSIMPQSMASGCGRYAIMRLLHAPYPSTGIRCSVWRKRTGMGGGCGSSTG